MRNLVVKKKTPFDDNVDVIKSLTLRVKEHLANQDFSLRSLQEIIDKQQKENNQNQQTQHSHYILTGLNSKLMYATEQFQNVLKTRTTQMKSDKKRRNLYTFDTNVKALSSTTVNAQPIPSSSSMRASPNHYSEEPSIKTEHIEELNSEGSQLLQTNNPINRNIIRSRTDDILDIEQDIEKLSGMFHHLAVMIKQQGELTQRIDQNLNMASEDLDGGQRELRKLWENTKGNTGLILKIFGVLAIFIIIIGLFVVR